MDKAVKEYGNLYTQWKFNGESLTSYYPTGNWQKKHQEMTAHGQTHIMNVHVLANLEPFRFAAPGFIQKCMQAGMHRLGTNGIHLVSPVLLGLAVFRRQDKPSLKTDRP